MPSVEPSVPSETPSVEPSVEPSVPSTEPSTEPSVPSVEPSVPSETPSVEPSIEPSIPSVEPSVEPSVPSVEPSVEPSVPSTEPSVEPSIPSVEPSDTPSSTDPSTPSVEPSDEPSSSNSSSSETNQIVVLNSGGYQEGAYVEISKINNLAINDYTFSYKKSGSSSYTKIDAELIRFGESSVRADILGLSAGTYAIKIEADNYTEVIDQIIVSNYDRSGYAHFESTEGVGAYNNDGTVKDNAVIVYVTEETKNTVTATIDGTKCTGISEILSAQQNSDYPLIVRIIGTIGAATWNNITYNSKNIPSTSMTDINGNVLPQTNLNEDDIIKGGYNTLNTSKYSKLNGLVNKIKYEERTYNSDGSIKKYEQFDSYYNMLDVKSAKNVTVEGVGPNAMIFQWGFTWKNCSNIEVRNLTFDDYTEDACSFEASETAAKSLSEFKTGNIWLHHNTFNEGINYWDVSYEQDKHEGDGATDFKGNKNITISYNHYYKNHKTGLIGGSDSNTTANVTFHHNFYEECSSRLPLGRQANMHMYNNYYYKSSSTNMSLRAGAYALIENCVFEDSSNPIETKTNATYGDAVAKVYNSKFINCTGANNGTVVDNRADIITNYNKFAPNFDTNSELFYYDAVNHKSNVSVMTELDDVAEFVKKYAGANADSFYIDNNNSNNNENNTENPGENTGSTWSTVVNNDFSSNTTINEVSSAPTSGGLYYYYTDGGNSTTNNINISNGKLNIIDTSTATTFGYYMFDNSYSSGKVRISLDFTPETSNTKWTMIHFLDGISDIGIRTDGEKILNYTTDAGSTLYKVMSSAMSANSTYSIVLTIDFESNIAKISINGSEVTISGYTCDKISGIKFQTAGSSSRSFAIDNIKIETA